MTFHPKVSIIIPVYNGSNYLREAIDSALAQTYKNIEVIVVNDGSNDGGKTEEIAISYGDITRYFYKENGGVASALNLGIRKMTGDYFSWLSHDDVYYPQKLERQIEYLKKERHDIVLYSDFEFIDHKSRFLKTHCIKKMEPKRFRYELILGNPIHGCTTLIPKRYLEDAGLFDENLKTTQDYALWFKMAKNHDFVHIPEVLIKSRLHSEQGSHKIATHTEEINSYYIWCLDEFSAEEINKLEMSLSLFYFRVALNLKKRGYREAAEYAIGLSFRNMKGQKLLKTSAIIVLFKFQPINKAWIEILGRFKRRLLSGS